MNKQLKLEVESILTLSHNDILIDKQTKRKMRFNEELEEMKELEESNEKIIKKEPLEEFFSFLNQ